MKRLSDIISAIKKYYQLLPFFINSNFTIYKKYINCISLRDIINILFKISKNIG